MKKKVAISICVPSDTRQFANWGDLYYAQSMKRAIENNGISCRIYCMDSWSKIADDEFLIHIRGLERNIPQRKEHSALWIINHPELLHREELQSFGKVFCASEKFSLYLNLEGVESEYLPQAGDNEHFFPIAHIEKKYDLLFVGNNHTAQFGMKRRIIEDLYQRQFSFKFGLIGAAWHGIIPESHIIADFCEWKDLNNVYQSAHIILNDHQDTMRQYGFINNRTFDLAMAQQFQISDHLEGMDDFGIITYTNSDDLHTKINHYLSDLKDLHRQTKIMSLLTRNENFTQRMQTLLQKTELI